MKKAERKRRAAEQKRKAKAAKKTKLEEATNPAGDVSPETGDLSAEASAKAEGPSTGSGQAACATEQPELSRPDWPLEDEVHRAHSKMYRAEAEMVEADTMQMLGDDEAIAMLTRAARSLDGVIQYVESVLKRLPAEQVAEALAIQDEPRRHGEKSRRGANPAVQLLNIRLRAKNLMLRVMKILKPDLAKQMQTA